MKKEIKIKIDHDFSMFTAVEYILIAVAQENGGSAVLETLLQNGFEHPEILAGFTTLMNRGFVNYEGTDPSIKSKIGRIKYSLR